MNKNYTITPKDAYNLIKENPSAIILDVRTPEEFATGKIPKAILMPSYAVREMAQRVLPNKSAMILVYCRSGLRSRDAANELYAMGYTNVYDFGGINAWPYERER